MEWQGRYFDGQTGTPQPVVVRVGDHGLQIVKANKNDVWWEYGEVRQTQGSYAGEQVRLERGGPVAEAILVDDFRFLSAVHYYAPGQTSFHDPARRSARIRFTILAGVCVPLIGVALYLWGVPAMAEALAERVPVSWDEQLGRSVLGVLAPPEERLVDPACTQILERIGVRLAGAVPDNPYTFRFILKKDSTVNAFAASGGYVVVHTELLRKTGSAEELAGVMAHEMQHILKRHTTESLFRDFLIQILIAAWSGDLSSLEYAMETAGTMGDLRFSRKAEEEADLEGLKLLKAARINPIGMVTFFKSLEDLDTPEILKYLSTHPRTQDRIRQLESLASEDGFIAVPLLPDVSWAEMKSGCSPDAWTTY